MKRRASKTKSSGQLNGRPSGLRCGYRTEFQVSTFFEQNTVAAPACTPEEGSIVMSPFPTVCEMGDLKRCAAPFLWSGVLDAQHVLPPDSLGLGGGDGASAMYSRLMAVMNGAGFTPEDLDLLLQLD